VAAALHHQLPVELEDLHLLPAHGSLGVLRLAFLRPDVLVAEQPRLEDPHVLAARMVALAEDRRRREDRVAGEERRGVAAGLVDQVAEGVVADVGAREAQAQHEGDAAEDDQLAADVLLRVEVDHELVAVHLAGVVEDRGQVDVLGVMVRPRECSMRVPGSKSSK
jgi:hypothetical protein